MPQYLQFEATLHGTLNNDQIEDIVASYPNVKLAVINQSDVEVIAGELSIFTVPVDLYVSKQLSYISFN
jgi:hypothetical protein